MPHEQGQKWELAPKEEVASGEDSAQDPRVVLSGSLYPGRPRPLVPPSRDIFIYIVQAVGLLVASPSQVHLRGAASLSPAPAGLIPVPMGVSGSLAPSVQMLLCWTIGLLVATVTGEDATAIPGEKKVVVED